MWAFPEPFVVFQTEQLQDDKVYGIRLHGKTVIVRKVSPRDLVPNQKIDFGELVHMESFHRKIQPKLKPYCAWWKDSKIIFPGEESFREQKVLGWVDANHVAISAYSSWAVVQIETEVVRIRNEVFKKVNAFEKDSLKKLLQMEKLPPMHIVLALIYPNDKPSMVDLVFQNNITSHLYSWTVSIASIRAIWDRLVEPEIFNESVSHILEDEYSDMMILEGEETLMSQGGEDLAPSSSFIVVKA